MRKSAPAYVYVASDGKGEVKVGKSIEPERRCKYIWKVELVHKVQCADARTVERLAHSLLIREKDCVRVCEEVFKCATELAVNAVNTAADKVRTGNYTEEDLYVKRMQPYRFGERTPVAFRVDAQLKADLQAIAKRDHRTLAGLMEHVLSAYAEQNQQKNAASPRKKSKKKITKKSTKIGKNYLISREFHAFSCRFHDFPHDFSSS